MREALSDRVYRVGSWNCIQPVELGSKAGHAESLPLY